MPNSTAEPEPVSGFTRFGKGILMSGNRAVGGIDRAIGNWFGSPTEINPEDEALYADPAPANWTQTAGEIGAGLAPIAVQAMIAGRVVKPMVAPWAAQYPTLARVATDAAEFGLVGAADPNTFGGTLGTEQAIEGGLYGAATRFSRIGRIPATAAIALASKAYFDSHNDSPVMPELLGNATQGDLNAVIGFGTSFLPGRAGAKRGTMQPQQLQLEGPVDNVRPEIRRLMPPALTPDEVIDPATFTARRRQYGTRYRPGQAPEPMYRYDSSEAAPTNQPGVTTIEGQFEVNPNPSPSVATPEALRLKEWDIFRPENSKPIVTAPQPPSVILAGDGSMRPQGMASDGMAPTGLRVTDISPKPIDFTPLGAKPPVASVANLEGAVQKYFGTDGTNEALPPTLDLIHYSREPLSLNTEPTGTKYGGGSENTYGYGLYAAESSDSNIWAKMDRYTPGEYRNSIQIQPKNPFVVTPQNLERLMTKASTEGVDISKPLEFDAWLKSMTDKTHDALIIRGFDLSGGKSQSVMAAVQKRTRELWQPKYPEGKTSGHFENGNELDAAVRQASLEVTGLPPETLNIARELQNQVFVPPQHVSNVTLKPPANQSITDATNAYYGITPSKGKVSSFGDWRAAADKIEPPVATVAKSEGGGTGLAPTIKKSPTFATDANWEVTMPNGEMHKIFRDPSDRMWYLDGDGHFSGRILSTGKQADAIANLSSRFPDQMKPKTGGFKKLTPLYKNEGGFVMPELNLAITHASVGALVGGSIGAANDEPGSHSNMLLGAMVGVAAAAFGPAAIGAVRSMAKAKVPVVPKTPGVASIAKTLGQRVEQWAGEGFNGSLHIRDRFVRFLDKAFDMTLAPEVKAALMQARTRADFHVAQIDAAMQKLATGWEPTQPMIDASNRILNGDPALSPQNYTAFAKAVGPEAEQYAKFVIAAAENRTALQRLARAGVKDAAQRAVMDQTMNQYVTRSYKLFTHNNWRPTDVQVERVAQELYKSGSWPGASEDALRAHVRQYVKEAKMMKDFYPDFGSESEKINQVAFKHRKQLSAAWRDMLGEITDPKERIMHTAFRLRPMAEAGVYFATLAKTESKGGLPTVFGSYAELEAHKAGIKTKLARGALAPDEHAQLTKNLISLDSYSYVDKLKKNGTLGGTVASRGVVDTLQTLESVTSASNPWFRSMSRFNSFLKTGKTVMSPITVLRNYMTMPAFAIIARVNPQYLREAHNLVRNFDHPMTKELFEMGIANSDQVNGEIIRDFRAVTGGKFDLADILTTQVGLSKLDAQATAKLWSKGFNAIANFYRYPDAMIRTASYLSAKARFAEEFQLPLDNIKVKEAAAAFTQRYTMNYSTVTPIVKNMRQMPFVSLFLSYSAEMARIGKNLIEDVAKGSDGVSHSRLYAAVPLAALALAPNLIQSAGESNLSAADLKEWERTKALMPEWERSAFKFVTGRNPDGKFTYTNFSPLVPADAFNQMATSLANGKPMDAMQANPVMGLDNSPILNIAASVMFGEDYRTHQQFRGFGDIAAMASREVLPSWFPNGTEWQRMQQAYTPNDKGTLGLTNSKTGKTITPSDFWFSYYTGMRSTTADLQSLQKMAVGKAKSLITVELSHVNTILKSNASQEEKTKVIDRTRESLKLIQATLRDQLQGSTPSAE